MIPKPQRMFIIHPETRRTIERGELVHAQIDPESPLSGVRLARLRYLPHGVPKVFGGEVLVKVEGNPHEMTGRVVALTPKQDPDLDEPVIELVLEGAWTGPAPRFRGVLCPGCGNWLTADRPEGARFMSCPECMRTVAP